MAFYVGEAEACDRVGFLSGGKLVAVGTPREFRKEAFGGEVVALSLGGDPGHLGAHLPALECIGHVAEIRGEDASDGPVSRVRPVVEDTDLALPRVFDALSSAGATVRSADVLTPSFDEIFFRIMKSAEDNL